MNINASEASYSFLSAGEELVLWVLDECLISSADAHKRMCDSSDARLFRKETQKKQKNNSVLKVWTKKDKSSWISFCTVLFCKTQTCV